ncbi:hypothetical protein KZO11_09930 [Streptomyces anulatus]|uniref:hypothetical protein n=1 Tax=Streptomyces anulatus TaxID=1892 RepID=UPI001C5EAC34|nr:hypothetical protein [Streptomyces anulatus]QYA94005.1 hypothetical protein KZO11_09930 [Streptomyces anulatus]
MPIFSGQKVTAGQLNRLQPTTYRAGTQTVALTGPLTNADAPGISIAFTTQTAGAVVAATIVCDFDPTTTIGGLSSGRLFIDGVGVGEFAVYQQGPGTTGDRGSTPQTYREVIPTAGTHTAKLVVTLATGMNLNVYSSVLLTVYEAV